MSTVKFNKLYVDSGWVLIISFLVWSGIGLSFEISAMDWFRRDHIPHPDVVILAVDNHSLEEIGRWPWDREVHARILDKLNTARPQVVAFDINFSETQSFAQDRRLKESMDQASFPIVLASEAVYTKGDNEPGRFIKPLSYFYENERVSLAHVNVQPDRDDMARMLPFPVIAGGETLKPFGHRIAEIAGVQPDQSSRRLIDFAGGAGTFTTYSITDFLNGKIKIDQFQDKIVLVGATASDLHDNLLAPVDGSILAGIEWHANVIDNLLLGRSISLIPAKVRTLATLILGFWLILFFRYTKTKTGVKLFAGIFVGHIVMSHVLWQLGIAWPYLLNVVMITAAILSESFYKWYRSEAEKRKLSKALQHYFSPQVLRHVLENPQELKLGGQRREVTIFFSDIRSFTTITESTDPNILSQMLHEYFTEMTEEVLKTDGVVDKFIGDAIMAFWGAPLEQKDQADRAIQASLAMLKKLPALQKRFKIKGWSEINIGIGLATGMATVGNMGSEKRFDYTVIGDSVNLAARLESSTKEFHTQLVLSESVKNKCTEKYDFESLGSITVKGKTQPVDVFTIKS